MTAEVLTSIRELDARQCDGIQVRLLWCEFDDRMWVTVIDIKAGYAFRVEVHSGERPLDVFHHPYAYAAHHGVETSAVRPDHETLSLAA